MNEKKAVPILILIIVLLLAGILMAASNDKPTKNPESGKWQCELTK